MGKIKTSIRQSLSFLLGKDFSSPALNKLLADSTIISFDVFDTLIIRQGLSVPSDLFNLIHPEDPTFKSRRIEAEKDARHFSPLEDIKLDSIYELLYNNLRERQEVQEAMALEISAELKFCKANPEALEFFNSVKYSGKRVVIISDMYLSAATISAILKNCGFDLEGVNVYVSSEYGLTKRSGSLFNEVLKQERIENPGSVLHIGDNLISDYLMARRVGLKSYLYSRRV